MTDARRYIPFGNLPRGPFSGTQSLQWCATDSLDNFKKRGPLATYSEKDFSYHFNTHGYRAPDFSPCHGLRMLSIGCSNVFGVGLPSEAIFHEVLVQNQS